jgi:hypothetical protein
MSQIQKIGIGNSTAHTLLWSTEYQFVKCQRTIVAYHWSFLISDQSGECQFNSVRFVAASMVTPFQMLLKDSIKVITGDETGSSRVGRISVGNYFQFRAPTADPQP